MNKEDADIVSGDSNRSDTDSGELKPRIRRKGRKPTEASLKARAQVAELDGAGLTHAQIANCLNDLQVPTPTGRGKWHTSNVKSILESLSKDEENAQIQARLEGEVEEATKRARWSPFETRAKLKEAESELRVTRRQLEESEQELTRTKEEVANVKKELAKAKSELDEANKNLLNAKQQSNKTLLLLDGASQRAAEVARLMIEAAAAEASALTAAKSLKKAAAAEEAEADIADRESTEALDKLRADVDTAERRVESDDTRVEKSIQEMLKAENAVKSTVEKIKDAADAVIGKVQDLQSVAQETAIALQGFTDAERRTRQARDTAVNTKQLLSARSMSAAEMEDRAAALRTAAAKAKARAEDSAEAADAAEAAEALFGDAAEAARQTQDAIDKALRASKSDNPYR